MRALGARVGQRGSQVQSQRGGEIAYLSGFAVSGLALWAIGWAIVWGTSAEFAELAGVAEASVSSIACPAVREGSSRQHTPDVFCPEVSHGAVQRQPGP
jgi:hypothetical protein